MSVGLAATLLACDREGLPPRPCLADGLALIGPAGGVIVAGEARVTLPSGALSSCQPLALAEVTTDDLPEGRDLEVAYQLSPAPALGRGVRVQLPLMDPAADRVIAYLADGAWVPLTSIPTPDRHHLLAWASRGDTFAVRGWARAADACVQFSCGGDVSGAWELSGVCAPRPTVVSWCPESVVRTLSSTVMTLQGGRGLMTVDLGPHTAFVPRSCLAAVGLTGCADIPAQVRDPESRWECADTAPDECGCTVTPPPGKDHLVTTFDYTVCGHALSYARIQALDGSEPPGQPMPLSFCRAGDNLTILDDAIVVSILHSRPPP
jgi:hypothetical protein